MMQVVIIEDERPSAERLATQLGKISAGIEVIGTLGSVSETRQWFKDNSPPDLIFMDIQLGDGTAFDFLSDYQLNTPIIFTTAFDEYAIKAFEYNSIDYLLKPIDQGKLNHALEKLKNMNSETASSFNLQDDVFQSVQRVVTGNFKKRFLVRLGDQFIPVDTAHIHYFYYDRGSSWIMTGEGKKYLIEHSLDQIENLVNPIDFYRINRQFIVTLRSIAEIHSYFNSRLLIQLKPTWNDDVIVARDRVTGFKRWMDL